MATPDTLAIAPDSRSIAGSGAIGKPGVNSSPNHGSSMTMICGERGNAVATATESGGDVRPHGAGGHGERHVVGQPGPSERHARVSPARRTAT